MESRRQHGEPTTRHMPRDAGYKACFVARHILSRVIMSGAPIGSLEELDVVLSRSDVSDGGEKSSLIREINSILSFISYQEDPVVQEQVSGFVIDSPFFQAHSDLFRTYLQQCALTVQPDNDLYGCLWLVYRVLVSLNLRSKDSLRFSLDERIALVPKLLKELKEPLDGLLELPALLLLSEIFRNPSLDPLELECFDDSDLLFLFTLSEYTRQHNEFFSYAVNKLLLCIHHQTLDFCPDGSDPFLENNHCRFRKKLTLSTPDDPFCDMEAPTDLAGLIRCSPILRFLQSNFHTAKTFGGDLVFMLNREKDLSSMCLILDFFTDLFNHPLTSEYLYTNDLSVLVDILVRELHDLDDSLDELRYSFLCTLSSLMMFSQYREAPHKVEEITRLLKHIIQTHTDTISGVSSQFFSQASKLLESWAY